ncbi:MAG: hypothetical protein KKD44_27760 [Proteobacteria bacterium]|nr:hypothetical protein [Pseudomonadota bacterium]
MKKKMVILFLLVLVMVVNIAYAEYLRDSYTSASGTESTHSTNWIAQLVKFSGSGCTLSSIDFNIKKANSPTGTLNIYYRWTISGSNQASGSYDIASLPSSYDWVNIPMSSASLQGSYGLNYFIIAPTMPYNGTNYVIVQSGTTYNNGGAYSGGPSSWVDISPEDLLFRVYCLPDTSSPSYTNFINNASTVTKYNGTVKWSVTLSDETGLSGYKFAHNQTGTLTNGTYTTTSGISSAINSLLNITLIKNNYICGQYWFNDTSNNENQTNLSCFTVANTAPTFNQTGFDIQIRHTQNLTIDVNCSDLDLDTITYFINNTLVTINSTTGIITDNPSQNEEGQYSLKVTCGDGYDNITNMFWYNITNTPPVVASATINDTSPDPTDDIQCNNGSITDTDGDTSFTLYYDWEKDNVWQSINNKVLGNGNTSANEIWRCKIWASDSWENSSAVTSSAVQIGTGQIAPAITSTNTTTESTSILSNSTFPTNNNSWVNMSVLYSDTNNDKCTAYFCSSDAFSSGSCTGTEYCHSVLNSTSTVLNCRFNVIGKSGEVPYYAFVLDNTSLVSASQSGTFEVNLPPNQASLTSPLDATFRNVNHNYLQFTATDPDGDTVNYTIYGDTNANPTTLIYTGTSTTFNWTGLSETTQYWKVLSTDMHGYPSTSNSSINYFIVDLTNPSLTVSAPSNGTTYNTESVTLTISASDTYLSICYYDLQYYDTSTYINQTATISCSSSSSLYTPYYAGGYKVTVYANDSASNINSTYKAFYTQILVSPTGGGGGGGGFEPPPQQSIEEQLQNVTLCGNGICQEGENSLNCWQDCQLNLDNTLFCFPLIKDLPILNKLYEGGECRWQDSWFVNSLFGIILVFVVVTERRKT